MAYYREADLSENRRRFRRNRNPGPGVVQGIGKLGTLQQVLWYPQHDAWRHETVFKKTPGNSDRLTMQVYSRRGNLLAEHLLMDSVSTSGDARHVKRVRRLSHLATTSTAGEDIAAALKRQPVLPVGSLDPEHDRYQTRGVSGLIAIGASGRRTIQGSYMLVHHPASLQPNGQVYHSDAAYDTLSEANFEPGIGVGAHAYHDGAGRQPFTGYRYAFPLGSSAENTLDIYHDLLGKRRGVNIAVKELLGSGAITLLAANASGEPA